jgi:hypothetical protein
MGLSMDSDPGEPVLNDTAYQDGTSPGAGAGGANTYLGFGARHPSTMAMALCDGSVRRFSYGSTNLGAIVSRNGGEVLTLDD